MDGDGVEVRRVAEYYLCRKSYTDFMKRLWIPDEHRGEIRFEPWPHLQEIAGMVERGENVVVLKARQVGVSWLFAGYLLWRAMYGKGLSLALSRTQPDAAELLAKVDRLYLLLKARRPWVCEEREAYRHGSPGEMVFRGGGTILALPSTEDAGRGYTAGFVFMDEVAFHLWAEANFAAVQPTLDGGGQIAMVSTSRGPSGLFYKTYQGAKQLGSPMKAVFVPWWSRPSRSLGDVQLREHVPNGIWLQEQRALFTGVPTAFRQEYPSTEEEAWSARQGLVYYVMDDDGQWVYSPDPHPRGNLSPDPCRWRECQWHFGYVDWGGGDPTALGLIGMTRAGRVHQYAEFTKTGAVPVSEIAAFFMNKAPHPDGWGMGFETIECGREAPNAIAELAALGLPARAADARREEGFATMSRFLKERRFTLNPARCPVAVEEFLHYRWAEKRDPTSGEMFATKTPHWTHGDHKDGQRYVLQYIENEELAPIDLPAAALAAWD